MTGVDQVNVLLSIGTYSSGSYTLRVDNQYAFDHGAYETVLFGDFNEDGKLDIIFTLPGSAMTIYYSETDSGVEGFDMYPVQFLNQFWSNAASFPCEAESTVSGDYHLVVGNLVRWLNTGDDLVCVKRSTGEIWGAYNLGTETLGRFDYGSIS